MESYKIVVLCILFLLNGVTIGISYQDDMKYQLRNWRVWLSILIGIWLGAPILILLVLGTYVVDFWKDYIWTEVSFYYKVHYTTWFEDLIKKKPNMLFEWNRLVTRHKEGTWIQRKLKRHVKVINKKFEYDYEAAVKAKEEADAKSWEESITVHQTTTTTTSNE